MSLNLYQCADSLTGDKEMSNKKNVNQDITIQQY